VKEALYLRVQILEQNGVISRKVADYTCRVTDQILEQVPDATQAKVEMFITHLAMAGKRAEEGTEENPIDGMILEAVKQEAAYPDALLMRDSLLSQTDLVFPETERDFLSVHLCNLLT